MSIDAKILPENTLVESDICIIGAGPAGMTLAREFSGQKFKVCLLEGGATARDEATQSLYHGKIVGSFSQNLYKSRRRQLGGTANMWKPRTDVNHYAARFVPLEEIDFEKRDWLPYSGWPFAKADLDPFYQRAEQLCRMKPDAYKVEDWEDTKNPQLPFVGNQIATTVYQFASRSIFTQELHDDISQSDQIITYLNANVVELETDDAARKVTRARVACLPSNKQFWVVAKVFILATGGIENARLLLLSNKTLNVGLGNQHDLVGRFFMEHLNFRLGVFTPANRQIFDNAALYDIHWQNNTLAMGKLTVTEKVRREQQMLNSCMLLFPQPKGYESPAVKSLKTLFAASRKAKLPKNAFKHLNTVVRGTDEIAAFTYGRTFKPKEFTYNPNQGGWSNIPGKARKFNSFEVRICTEQAPNPNIRVMLGTECDRLGLPKIQPIHSNWSDIEINSIMQVQKILKTELAQAGLGQFQSWTELDETEQPQDVAGGHHHMGTTRMHSDPKQGVVDQNCCVHGVSNLFVAGSSVFPTGGVANPTLTVIALAIRLADRVKKVMASEAAIRLGI